MKRFDINTLACLAYDTDEIVDAVKGESLSTDSADIRKKRIEIINYLIERITMENNSEHELILSQLKQLSDLHQEWIEAKEAGQ